MDRLSSQLLQILQHEQDPLGQGFAFDEDLSIAGDSADQPRNAIQQVWDSARNHTERACLHALSNCMGWMDSYIEGYIQEHRVKGQVCPVNLMIWQYPHDMDSLPHTLMTIN